MVIAVGIWSSVEYQVTSSDELKVLLVHLAFVAWGLWGLFIALSRFGLLV